MPEHPIVHVIEVLDSMRGSSVPFNAALEKATEGMTDAQKRQVDAYRSSLRDIYKVTAFAHGVEQLVKLDGARRA